MIVTILERLCTLSGHQFGGLCSYVVRQDQWWLNSNPASSGASPKHREMRDRFASGTHALPFPTGDSRYSQAAPAPPAAVALQTVSLVAAPQALPLVTAPEVAPSADVPQSVVQQTLGLDAAAPETAASLRERRERQAKSA